MKRQISIDFIPGDNVYYTGYGCVMIINIVFATIEVDDSCHAEVCYRATDSSGQVHTFTNDAVGVYVFETYGEAEKSLNK